MAELALYSRSGCHLCDEMIEALRPMLDAADSTLRVVDIDADPALREKYGWRVPVLTLEDIVICEGRLDEDMLRDALALR
ncbi:MAG: glutaredoxin family protein [Proteobacteria bacterium]|nr:glutaredoxin family protein [Pseudomonadota bacterium]